MTSAGRNDRATREFATVDWMAYQGAPNGGVSGKTRMPEWWTGTKCEKVIFPQARTRHALKPSSLVTENHVKLRMHWIKRTNIFFSRGLVEMPH